VECGELALLPRETGAHVNRMHVRRACLRGGEDRAVEAGGEEYSG
jgi:hypothetical protein